MRTWFRITALRGGLIVIPMSTIAALLIWWPTIQAPNVVHGQVTATAQADQVYQKSIGILNAVPSINAAGLQQLGQFDSYANSVQQAADKLSAVTVQIKLPKSILGLSINMTTEIIPDTNAVIEKVKKYEIYQHPRDGINSASHLLTYQAKVSTALVSLMEYDPSIDVQGFSLGSSDSNKRLQLAAQGLTKINQHLQAISNAKLDPTISQVVVTVNTLSTAQASWAHTGQTEPWISAVTDAQNTIVANRSKFWVASLGAQLRKLSIDHTEALEAQKLWNSLAQKKY